MTIGTCTWSIVYLLRLCCLASNVWWLVSLLNWSVCLKLTCLVSHYYLQLFCFLPASYEVDASRRWFVVVCISRMYSFNRVIGKCYSKQAAVNTLTAWYFAMCPSLQCVLNEPNHLVATCDNVEQNIIIIISLCVVVMSLQGFPYNSDLRIAGIVLSSVSFTCLVLSLLSFIISRWLFLYQFVWLVQGRGCVSVVDDCDNQTSRCV